MIMDENTQTGDFAADFDWHSLQQTQCLWGMRDIDGQTTERMYQPASIMNSGTLNIPATESFMALLQEGTSANQNCSSSLNSWL
jgi:hypothetical protein